MRPQLSPRSQLRPQWLLYLRTALTASLLAGALVVAWLLFAPQDKDSENDPPLHTPATVRKAQQPDSTVMPR